MLYIVGRVLVNLLTPGKSEVFYIFKKYEPSACGDRVTSVYLGQYHDCWCPGSSSRQDISSHDIHYIEYVGPYLTWGRILSTCVISRWSNDTRWRKYMFMFPLKNLAHKELTAIRHQTRSHYLTQCWSISMVTFVVNRPQWVKPFWYWDPYHKCEIWVNTCITRSSAVELPQSRTKPLILTFVSFSLQHDLRPGVLIISSLLSTGTAALPSIHAPTTFNSLMAVFISIPLPNLFIHGHPSDPWMN